MKIGLVDVDGHGKSKKWGATIYPNLALAKIAAYHRSLGNSVEWYEPMFSTDLDIVYMAKVFNFTTDYPYTVRAKQIVKGGTGYDIQSRLPQEIDDMQPDFSIYPQVSSDLAYGFLTRGCPNKCPWCVVPRKEGHIRPYWDVERVANGKRKLILMDNNILAAGDYAIEQLDKIIANGYHVDFNQALDARLVNEEFATRLAKIHWLHSRIRFGCDTTPQIQQCQRAMDLLNAHGFRGEFFLYTIIGGVKMTSGNATTASTIGVNGCFTSVVRTKAMRSTPTHSRIVIRLLHRMTFRNGKRTWLRGATSA